MAPKYLLSPTTQTLNITHLYAYSGTSQVQFPMVLLEFFNPKGLSRPVMRLLYFYLLMSLRVIIVSLVGRDGSVGIATRYMLNGPGIVSR